MTIWISREVLLFNFERLDILCAWIEHLCKRLWQFEFPEASFVQFRASPHIMRLNRTSEWKVISFEFLERFRCLISSVVINYAPESVIRVKSYDHLHFSRASVVKFRASRYIMLLNRTSMWKVLSIGISRGHPLFNFKRLDKLCPRIVHSSEKLWPLEFFDRFRCSISSVSIYYAPESDIRVKSDDHLNFSRASVVQFRASRYIMTPNRTFVWKVMTIWISREVSLFNFEPLDILCAWIGHPCEKVSPFKFFESFRCSILNVSIYYVPESDIRVISYDHLNFSRGSVVQFRASRYIMRLSRTSVWKVMTI